MMNMLTPEQVERYRRDGFLVVKQVVTGDELARLQAVADRVTSEGVEHGRALDAERPVELKDDTGFTDWQPDEAGFLYGRAPDGARVFRRAELLWQRDAAFRVTTVHPGILNAIWQILDDDVVPTNDAMVVKMPGAGAAVPWHRDPPGQPLIDATGDASPDFTCDLYLDRSTVDNGCVWAIPGSHRAGGPAAPEDPLDFDAAVAVPVEAEPGDLLLHSTGVLHGSPRNTSNERRRTFYVHYRPPAELVSGWWSRPPEWVDGQIRFLKEALAERAALGIVDPEPYLRPLDVSLRTS